MSNTRRKSTAKRVVTKTATYYNYGVTPITSKTKSNYLNFAAGVFLTLVIYLAARAFGI